MMSFAPKRRMGWLPDYPDFRDYEDFWTILKKEWIDTGSFAE